MSLSLRFSLVLMIAGVQQVVHYVGVVRKHLDLDEPRRLDHHHGAAGRGLL